jgi:hypothetical protein
VRGQDAHVTEDHEQAQHEEVSRHPALAAHGRQEYMPSFVESRASLR